MTTRRSFVPSLAVFTLACAAVLYVVLRAVHSPLTVHYLIALLYFPGITAVLHGWQEASFATDPKGFVRRFMLGLVLKMCISLAVLVIGMLVVPKDVLVPFTLAFATFYLGFLVFSTIRLIRLSRSATRP